MVGVHFFAGLSLSSYRSSKSGKINILLNARFSARASSLSKAEHSAIRVFLRIKNNSAPMLVFTCQRQKVVPITSNEDALMFCGIIKNGLVGGIQFLGFGYAENVMSLFSKNAVNTEGTSWST